MKPIMCPFCTQYTIEPAGNSKGRPRPDALSSGQISHFWLLPVYSQDGFRGFFRDRRVFAPDKVLVPVGFQLLNGTGDVGEHSVGLGAYQPDGADDYHQDNGQHNGILSNVLALFVSPQFNDSSHKGNLPSPLTSLSGNSENL